MCWEYIYRAVNNICIVLQMRRNSEDTAYASANLYNRNQNVYSESGYSCCSSNNDCQNCAGKCFFLVK